MTLVRRLAESNHDVGCAQLESSKQSRTWSIRECNGVEGDLNSEIFKKNYIWFRNIFKIYLFDLFVRYPRRALHRQANLVQRKVEHCKQPGPNHQWLW